MGCKNSKASKINLNHGCTPCNSCNSCGKCACECTCSLPDYDNEGCLTQQPTDCAFWSGNAYPGLSIVKGELLTSVLNKVLTILLEDPANNVSTFEDIDTKFTNVLIALNNINTRLNAIEGSTHPPYTI